MRAELEFDTPDHLVVVSFPDYQCEGIPEGATLKICRLPFVFAKELQRRWNAHNHQEHHMSVDFAKSEEAANRAAAHAENVRSEWRIDALNAYRVYAKRHFEFTTEDVRLHAVEAGLDSPPDPRAWGAIQRAAKREGIIHDAGRDVMSRSPTRNTTRVRLFRSRIYYAE